MSRIIYYLFIKPISLLPFSVLFLLSDGLYFILFKIAGYRKKVVFGGIQRSFPEKSPKEVYEIASKFYHHFCDLIVESLKLFSITAEEMVAHCRVVNPEFIHPYRDAGQSIIIAGGHYNNWEMLATGINLQMDHLAVGIYAPLKNEFLNKKITASRSKFGIELLSKKQVRQGFEKNKDVLTAVFFGTDQSPSSSKNAYWMEFLHQDTAVLFGTEKYAKDYNYPVVFLHVYKVKRGFYEMKYELITDTPNETAYGEITEKHTRLLEADIRAQPEYWLWTHKRWKRKREDQ